jgi:hypothetical protein
MQRMRWPPAFLALAVLGLAPLAGAAVQPPAATPSPEPVAAEPGTAVDAPAPTEPPDSVRPGRYRLGPFYVSPRFRVNSIGFDSNVNYTPTDRHADLTASGGPGLDVVLPVGHSSRVALEGQLDYVHFLRTPSLRHLAGGGRALAERNTPRSEFSLSHARMRSYRRPSFEVDERVIEDRQDTMASLRQRVLGRISVRAGGGVGTTDLPAGQEFLGVDLRQTMSTERWQARAGLDYTLTVKTRALVEAEREETKFPLLPLRNGVQDVVRAGLQTDSTALISGRLLIGAGWFHPASPLLREIQFSTASVSATWHVSPRTHLGIGYEQGLEYSALARATSPKLHTRRYSAHVEKELIWRMDLRLSGSITHLRNDGSVDLVTPEGQVSGTRRDRSAEAAADLGYRFRSRLRLGVRASYTERSSTFDYFGIDGLLVGVTVNYEP